MEARLTIVPDPAAINEVEAFLDEVAQRAGLDEDRAGNLIIAGTEAANNAILHGSSHQNQGRVTLCARWQEESRLLTLAVEDQGGGFDPQKIDDPRQPENLLEESGRGLLIIEHLMDEVRVERTASGTIVTMSLSYA